jgi:hypothetical protein
MKNTKNWHPPRKPDDFPATEHLWPRMTYALHLLATSGLAIRYELSRLVAEHFRLERGPRAMRYTFDRLEDLDLIEKTTLKVVYGHSLAAVRLSKSGLALCKDFGWEAVENEWQRMNRLHSGSDQPKHTAAVLSMAYQARLRGWQTQVVPGTSHPAVFPDLVLQRDDECMYVEVELRHGKLNKWRNLHELQGYVALCAKTEESCTTLVGECRQLGIPVIATDLLSLAQTLKEPERGPLWLQSWNKDLPA